MRARVVGLRESAVVVSILRMKKELRHLLLWSSHCRLSAKNGDHLSSSSFFLLNQIDCAGFHRNDSGLSADGF